jgi:hypothetical protein
MPDPTSAYLYEDMPCVRFCDVGETAPLEGCPDNIEDRSIRDKQRGASPPFS